MLLSVGGDRPSSPAPLTGCLSGPRRARCSAGPQPGILPAAGAEGRERCAGLRLSPARPPLHSCRRCNGQVSACFPHFCSARLGGCLRSVVTCHCRSCSFIKLCLLLAPAPPVLPLSGGRVLGVNWFCAEGSRGARRGGEEKGGPGLQRAGKRGPSAPRAPAAARSPCASSQRGRGGGASARRREVGFALEGAHGAGPCNRHRPAEGERAGGLRRVHGLPASGPSDPVRTSALLGNFALFLSPAGVCLTASLCVRLLVRAGQQPMEARLRLRSRGNLLTRTGDGWGVFTRLRGRCALGRPVALPCPLWPPHPPPRRAAERAGGRWLRGARAPGRWSRGERRRRRLLISA